MRVIITGGTGLLGRAISHALTQRGDKVIILSRDVATARNTLARHGIAAASIVAWDGRTAQGWGHLITLDATIINLAGASPAHWRWTPAYRRVILESRLHACAAVRDAISRYGAPAVLIQVSASGFYGDRGDEFLNEASASGYGFRAEVCLAWEAASDIPGVRRSIMRTGIALASDGGAFPLLRLFARLCGKRLGTGQQWIPWVHIADVAAAFVFVLDHPEIAGPVNLCAPEPVRHSDFIRAMQVIERRPALFPLLTPVLRLALGEMASTVLDSQRMLPQRLVAHGFSFAYPHLDEALRDLLGEKMV